MCAQRCPTRPSSFYIDGELDSTGAIPAPVPHDEYLSSSLLVGKSPDGPQYYEGQIKELRVWNTARDAEQIAMHMHRPVPAEAPGLLAYWRLNEIAETVGRRCSLRPRPLGKGVPTSLRPRLPEDLSQKRE